MNKIPVLDKGYLTEVRFSMERERLMAVQAQFFKGKVTQALLDIPKIHMEIKCPLFVQLSLSENLTTVSRVAGKPEAFIPSVNDVAGKDLKTSEMIAKDMDHTTQALLINPSAYQMDGCDIFISQVLSPISIYNTILVSGSLNQWTEFTRKEGLPAPIEQYRKAIEEVLVSEYDFLWDHIRAEKKEARSKDRKRVRNKDKV